MTITRGIVVIPLVLVVAGATAAAQARQDPRDI